MTDTRVTRGLKLYKERGHEVKVDSAGRYLVPACSRDMAYTVDLDRGEHGACSCPDAAPVCKHKICATLIHAKRVAHMKRRLEETHIAEITDRLPEPYPVAGKAAV